jgi:hypothetical protein
MKWWLLLSLFFGTANAQNNTCKNSNDIATQERRQATAKAKPYNTSIKQF